MADFEFEFVDPKNAEAARGRDPRKAARQREYEDRVRKIVQAAPQIALIRIGEGENLRAEQLRYSQAARRLQEAGELTGTLNVWGTLEKDATYVQYDPDTPAKPTRRASKDAGAAGAAQDGAASAEATPKAVEAPKVENPKVEPQGAPQRTRPAAAAAR